MYSAVRDQKEHAANMKNKWKLCEFKIKEQHNNHVKNEQPTLLPY